LKSDTEDEDLKVEPSDLNDDIDTSELEED